MVEAACEAEYSSRGLSHEHPCRRLDRRWPARCRVGIARCRRSRARRSGTLGTLRRATMRLSSSGLPEQLIDAKWSLRGQPLPGLEVMPSEATDTLAFHRPHQAGAIVGSEDPPERPSAPRSRDLRPCSSRPRRWVSAKQSYLWSPRASWVNDGRRRRGQPSGRCMRKLVWQMRALVCTPLFVQLGLHYAVTHAAIPSNALANPRTRRSPSRHTGIRLVVRWVNVHTERV